MAKLVEKGKMTAGAKAGIMGRINTTSNLRDMEDAGYVADAVFENMAVKESIFSQLDGICGKDVIIDTNTSTIRN